MKNKLISGLLKFVIVCISMTCRFKVVQGEDSYRAIVRDKKIVIYSFWHNRIFYMIYFVNKFSQSKGLPVSILISNSKDGELVSAVLKRFKGFKGKIVRGSTSKGSYGALKGMLKSIQEGYSPVFTPDGPRGPRYSFQAGPIFVSSMSQIPILPISCAFEKAWVLNSWDKFMIPKPFSKIHISIGELVQIPQSISEGDILIHKKNLEEIMLNLSPEFIDRKTADRKS